MEKVDGKDTIFGNEVIQLKTNKIPKGLVALERFFDNSDKCNMRQNCTHEQVLEEINLGIENAPKKVYIGKRLNPKVGKC